MKNRRLNIFVTIAFLLTYAFIQTDAVQAQTGTTLGTLRSVSSIDCFGRPGTGNFGSVIVNRNNNQVTVEVTLTGGLPNTTFSIELWEAGPGCFPDNNGDTGVRLTTDASGNGSAVISLTLPYTSLAGNILGDGAGTEQIVISLDRSLSQSGGDTYATEPISLPDSNDEQISVTVTPTVFSIGNNASNASVFYSIDVLRDDEPVVGAQVFVNGENKGFTGSTGRINASLPMRSPSILGEATCDFNSEFIFTCVKQITVTVISTSGELSQQLDLYTAQQIDDLTLTMSENFAELYESGKINRSIGDPSGILPSPSSLLSGELTFLKSANTFLTLIGTLVDIMEEFLPEYHPQAGDVYDRNWWIFSTTNVAPIYFLEWDVTRNGIIQGSGHGFTTDPDHFERRLRVAEEKIVIRAALASPAVLHVIDPSGERAGFDPITLDPISDFPVLFSDPGDEPFEFFILDPLDGKYRFDIVGTGEGGYSFKLQTASKDGGEEFNISGVISTGEIQTVTAVFNGTDTFTLSLPIDIKPGSDRNSINCEDDDEVITVAILSTKNFDATTVDHTTVTFEGASEMHVDEQSGEPLRHEEDVDGNGDTDLVFHFRLGDTNLTCGSKEGTLIGETSDGLAIEGTDSISLAELINDLLNLDNITTSYNPTPVPDAPAGVYTISATFSNISATDIKDLFFNVAELTGGNVVLNADGGAGGVGPTVSVPLEVLSDDAVLTPRESFTIDFDIGLTSLNSFDFFVDAYGVMAEEVRPVGTTSTGEKDSFQFKISEEQLQAGPSMLYLPIVVK